MEILTPQQIKALDIKKHTIITANAGSGKTFILTKRFLESIIKEGLRFNEIVALTFTEKAAAELITKISSSLDNEIKNTTDNQVKSNLKKFREYILSAKISTIHSFCFDILKEFPVEANIDPSTEIIDDIRKKDLISKCIEDTLVERIDNLDVQNLLRMFGKDTTENILINLIEKRFFADQLINKLYSFDSDPDKNFEEYYFLIQELVRKYLNEIYSEKFQLLLQLLPELKNLLNKKKNLDSIIASINELIDRIKKFLNSFDIYLISQIVTYAQQNKILTTKFELNKNTFRYEEQTEPFQTINNIFSELKFFNQINLDKEIEKQRFLSILSFIDLYKSAKEKYHQLKEIENVLDFDDLLLITDQLLENQNVREILSKRFKFILVDEFQDTDSIQFNILRKLTNDFDKDHNIFVVGDEKQSIYGFRNAELKVFLDFKNHIKKIYAAENAEGVITLSTSYRTTPSIAAFVNLIFTNLLKDRKVSGINFFQNVEYSPLQIGRGNYHDAPITFLISNREEIQSEKVARYILNLVNLRTKIFDRKLNISREIGFGDFALLFRERQQIKDYENTFIKMNIPFVVSGGRGYYQSEEIQDWGNYLSFLTNPSNDYALIAILRSPFFALSDNDIFKISLSGGNSFYEKLKNSIERSAEYREIVSLLEHHLKISIRYNLPELLQEILNDTNYYGKIDYSHKKIKIIANVEKLIDIAQNVSTRGMEDIISFVRYLKEAYVEVELPEATLSEIKGSVQLMTIHQSKGLEFPIVILPDFEKPLKSSNIKFGEITINDYFGICFKIFDEASGNNIHTISSALGNQINEEINYNEQLRVLYVALTRSTEKLVISFHHDESNDKTKNSESYKKIILDNLPLQNLNQGSITIPTQLTFVKRTENRYREESENYNLHIEVIKDIAVQPIELHEKQAISKEPTSPQIFIDNIKDVIKEEIFTATQINAYEFCPRKYLLKYVIGYNPDKLSIKEDEFEHDIISGADFGKVFHSLMEKIDRLDINQIEKLIEEILLTYPESIKKSFQKELKSKLGYLINFQEFKNIFNAPSSFSEFEIKVKFKNHILMGIIDRINIHSDRITIVDFKTDNFELSDYNQKVREYLTQMDFYILIASEYFKDNKTLELMLFFVSYPDKPFLKRYTQREIENIKQRFEKILALINQKYFEKNSNNCKICEYSKEENCII